MPHKKIMPSGQIQVPTIFRFGLPTFAKKIEIGLDKIEVKIKGDVKFPLLITNQLHKLKRVSQLSDFHCVATWSVVDLRWSGFLFRDFYEQIIIPSTEPSRNVKYVVFEGIDGYRVSMLLEDLMSEDVLLADSLNDRGLGMAHGAPIRLVAPSHYGYKSLKHICSISFLESLDKYSFPFPYPNCMDHLRARVAFEERGFLKSKKLTRLLYRALLPIFRYWFEVKG